MATLKQIQANRLNAQRSTGPRTDAGRAASAQNSRRHGCYSSQVVIEGQDQEQFDLLLDEFMEELQPQTLRERNLVEQMAVEWWHLGQCEFMRQSFFSHQRKLEGKWHDNWAELSEAERTKLVGENIAFYHLKDMNRISELKSRVYRGYHRASREFDRARDERLRREAEPDAGVPAELQPLPQLADVSVESDPAPPTPPPPPSPTGRPPATSAGRPAPITNASEILSPDLPSQSAEECDRKPAGHSPDLTPVDPLKSDRRWISE
jgi:hypothetical protein